MTLGPVVQNPDNFIHPIVTIQLCQRIPFDAFGEISAEANDSYTFTLFCIRFIWLYRVFPIYFIYWIAVYPADSAIHPLNNWCLEISPPPRSNN